MSRRNPGDMWCLLQLQCDIGCLFFFFCCCCIKSGVLCGEANAVRKYLVWKHIVPLCVGRDRVCGHVFSVYVMHMGTSVYVLVCVFTTFSTAICIFGCQRYLPTECSLQLTYNLPAISFTLPLINLSFCFVINLHLLRNKYRTHTLSMLVIPFLTFLGDTVKLPLHLWQDKGRLICIFSSYTSKTRHIPK